MIFRTDIPAPQYPFKIDHSQNIMLIGSCFSDNIGNFFATRRFNTCSNPFGVLFNPVSIDHAIRLMLHPEQFDKDRYFYKNRDLWVSFAHHGRFSNEDYGVFERGIDEQLHSSSEFLRKTDILFITFGTAYCYNFRPRDLVVANCHKIPNCQFDRFRLEPKSIVQQYKSTVAMLREVRPGIRIVFTVSPVRHRGDGMHGNALSKSVLLLAVDKLLQDDTLFYFPAYEFIMDDLRDYRFYAKDLCHPNDFAVGYLQEKVAESFFAPETVVRIAEIERENRFDSHRRLH